jgi:hypothetical protein
LTFFVSHSSAPSRNGNAAMTSRRVINDAGSSAARAKTRSRRVTFPEGSSP